MVENVQSYCENTMMLAVDGSASLGTSPPPLHKGAILPASLHGPRLPATPLHEGAILPAAPALPLHKDTILSASLHKRSICRFWSLMAENRPSAEANGRILAKCVRIPQSGGAFFTHLLHILTRAAWAGMILMKGSRRMRRLDVRSDSGRHDSFARLPWSGNPSYRIPGRAGPQLRDRGLSFARAPKLQAAFAKRARSPRYSTRSRPPTCFRYRPSPPSA